MRNLKRALSLALASVMLLGMMVVGTSAAFSDADTIVNKEAVEITAGLGLFAGSEGKFNPTGTVTRAQMATVIVKMLYGSEINADQFKGTGKFSDTVNFEGGWAEGYINLCANLGIVGGYGDGTFKPGNAVTTAEAVTMIINALGVDAGKGTWPLTVMAKAEEMELFAELAVKPGTNVALTRDQLASIVLEGIKYSPKGANGYSVPGVNFTFTDVGDALNAALQLGLTAADVDEVIGEDALINSVFEVKTAKGIVYANEANTFDSEGITNIGGVEYAISTGLEDLGRYVTVYYKETYKNEKEPGVTYCLVDEATKVVLTENILAGETNQAKQFRAAFGTKTIANNAEVFENYVYDSNASVSFSTASQVAAKGTYYINENVTPAQLVSYVKNADTIATYVTKVTTTAGKESIALAGVGTLKNNADEDIVVEYDGIKKDDYVTYVKAGDIYTISPVTTVEGKISKTSTTKIDDVTYDVVTVDGKDYILYNNANNKTGLSLNTTVSGFFNGTYKLFIAANGRVLGWEVVSGQADLSNIVYVVDVYEVATTDATYGTESYKVYAQGVDMEGKEVTYVLAVAQTDSTDVDNDNNKGVDILYDDSALALIGENNYAPGQTNNGLVGGVKGFFTFEKSDVNKAAALGVMIPEAVPAAYDEVTAPIYGKAVNTSAAVTLDGKTTNVPTTDGTAYVAENTKFIMVTGSKTTLTSGIITGTINYTIAQGENAGVLLSKNADGNKIIEVMVIAQDPESISNGEFMYVSAVDGAAKEYSNELGDVFTAYNNKGEKVEITVSKNTTFVGGGFYTYTVDADGIYTLNADTTQNAWEGMVFDTIFNGKLSAFGTNNNGNITNIDHFDLSNAIVIDVRSESAIEASESYAIETVAELQALKNIDKADITIDVYDDGDENVVVIFITEVTALYVPDETDNLTLKDNVTLKDNESVIATFTKTYMDGNTPKYVDVKIEFPATHNGDVSYTAGQKYVCTNGVWGWQ